MSGFLSRLFNRGTRQQQGRPRSSTSGGAPHLQRAATAPETTTCASSDDEENFQYSEVRRPAMRTEDVPGALPVLPAIPRRAGAELRRSQTFNITYTLNGERASMALSSARQSVSSSCDGSLDDQLRKLYGRVKTCHRGKMALILEGTDRVTKRRVVIKAFSKANMTQSKQEKVDRELAVLQRTAGCAGVVRMVNTLEDMVNTYVVLEGVSGSTLIELMADNGGRLSEAQAVPEVVRPLVQSVAALHSMGIVHRDIKPEHIMCISGGGVKLVDFCEAAQQPGQCLNQRVGQLEYNAPEVLSKPSAEEIFHQVLYHGMSEQELPQYNEKADVWSVGVVVHEALTGVQPFLAETREELAQLHQQLIGQRGPNGLPRLLDPPAPGLSPEACSFLEQALQLDPEKRASAQQLLAHPWLAGAGDALVAAAVQAVVSSAPRRSFSNNAATVWHAAAVELVAPHMRTQSHTSMDGGLLAPEVSVR